MTPSFLAVQSSHTYIGRFAPSPSGPLHFGSLVAALGSFLRAKQHNGRWLLRIEDIDPPREQQGAVAAILHTLEQHGLYWDGPAIYQSQQGELYEQALSWLKRHRLSYYCRCTRKQYKGLKGKDSCPCLGLNLAYPHCAIRFKNTQPLRDFYDQRLQKVEFEADQAQGDFILKRRDGLYAYQLAVVIDDIAQGVTEVVRGADLLQASAYQLALYQAFSHPPPDYFHLPLVVSQPGIKLSKQNHAPALDNRYPVLNLTHALAFLGLSVPKALLNGSVNDLLSWAIKNWNVKDLKLITEGIDNRIGRSDSI